MADTSWKAMDSGVMDWLDNKRAKTLRVSNDRESFQLKRIRRSLETMKSMNDNLMKQEERKVKRWLAKQAELSPSASLSYKNLYKIPSSEVTQEANQEGQQVSERGSAETPWSQFGDHLPNFVSFLRQPTKRPGCDKKHSKDFTPFSGTDLSMQTVFARTSYGSRGSFYNPHPTASVSKKDISARQLYVDNNSFSMQEAISMFPSLQKLSVTGEKFSFSKLHLHETASGSPASERRLKGLLERAREEEKFKQTVTLPQIRPEEFLSCRYLRLSQSNINTLLQLCKESGVHIDIHPHMKESEIDINTVLSSSLSRAV
ncbi:uncharacterized protein C16orf78 homolog isoform X1 [Mauremys reevesii]|uniref:uncharacterized protein C16orf78 homolog isoform X1 n=2 Tax=Mauremys reevesii TaxID=260615 RepID=UPI00193ED670|nr:uncharacterized protein C16orf78 homolog isoform X1 [Mauremys reevesii]XP_039358456.1 uncharacterized protein C16orf78 homolog isoform X1 [Mauremys reevesii]